MKANHSHKQNHGPKPYFHRPKAEKKPRSNRWFPDYGDDEEPSFEKELNPKRKNKRNRVQKRYAFDEEYDFLD